MKQRKMNKKKDYLLELQSKCCQSPVNIRHSYTDYKGNIAYDVTAWHECNKCKKPCDVEVMDERNSNDK